MATIFEAKISDDAIELLSNLLSNVPSFDIANNKIISIFNIVHFFNNQDEYLRFKELINNPTKISLDLDRTEYGDFQTSISLSQSIAIWLNEKKDICPKIIIEPTCGKGNFIVAALKVFKNIKKIIGVEIYKPYTWEAKFNIIDFYISNPNSLKPEINILHANAFNFNFDDITSELCGEILILGNPPWVTNSKLSTLRSNNLPEKSNFKKLNGFEAITGKGNFDIGEYITLLMLKSFQGKNGHIAFLVKNSVIKNLVFDQSIQNFRISNIEKLTIDSKKEFNVSVEASLFFCKLNSLPESICKEYNFYDSKDLIKEFGWIEKKFVSNTIAYISSKGIDGACPFEWRQGIKHDLSSIMELDRVNGSYINGSREEIILENDLIYGILKSSDLKQNVISKSRKFTIVTQQKIGQETSYISKYYPLTYNYLHSNKLSFSQRKSSIYNNKPEFSIFGVGEYSFAKYKVAISGLYKTYNFCLILPYENKPLMLDDTCYMLGFDDLQYAAYTSILLNSDQAKTFLQAITFPDAKRMFTKEVLKRIDLNQLAELMTENTLVEKLNLLNSEYNLNLSVNKWNSYLKLLKPKSISEQTSIFSEYSDLIITA